MIIRCLIIFIIWSLSKRLHFTINLILFTVKWYMAWLCQCEEEAKKTTRLKSQSLKMFLQLLRNITSHFKTAEPRSHPLSFFNFCSKNIITHDSGTRLFFCSLNSLTNPSCVYLLLKSKITALKLDIVLRANAGVQQFFELNLIWSLLQAVARVLFCHVSKS